MAIKAVLASLDGVDEALKAHYAAGEDGRFYAAVEGIEEMPAFASQRAKAVELLDEKKKLQQKFEALGVSTPEEITALKEAATKAGGKQVEELQAKLAQASEAAQKEIAKAKEEAEAERGAARSYFKQGEITRAISAHKGVPELLAHVVDQHLDVQRTDSGFALRVLGKDGQPRVKNSAGDAFGLEDLVAELKADPKYGRAFEPDGKTGSGAAPESGGGIGAKTVRAGDLESFGANLEAIAKGDVKVVAG
jgi:hypothetical protein